MQKRRRFKQSTSLQDRLASFAKQVSDQASNLPPGPDRDVLLRKARQAENASRLDNFLVAASNSQEDRGPAVAPPKDERDEL